MAYGQTGSGKSYTMLGPHSEEESGLLSGADEDSGIIPRAAEELFRYAPESEASGQASPKPGLRDGQSWCSHRGSFNQS